MLDPFNGSGSTGVGALYEGMNYIGIEREDQYAEIAAARLKYAEEHSELKPFPKVGQKVGKEQVQEAVQSAERTIPLPENEELRKALGISEEVKTDKPTGSLSEAAFKRLVAKSLRK